MSRLIGIFFAEDPSDSFDFHRTKDSVAFRMSVSRTIKPHTDTLMTALDTDICVLLKLEHVRMDHSEDSSLGNHHDSKLKVRSRKKCLTSYVWLLQKSYNYCSFNHFGPYTLCHVHIYVYIYIYVFIHTCVARNLIFKTVIFLTITTAFHHNISRSKKRSAP